PPLAPKTTTAHPPSQAMRSASRLNAPSSAHPSIHNRRTAILAQHNAMKLSTARITSFFRLSVSLVRAATMG
ncbi:MAG: hypothetical protein KF768_10910, partial [Phycisphaeraceae bacterium]|nr:hypothetical protein [Phycisphaeraceae bacterium]